MRVLRHVKARLRRLANAVRPARLRPDRYTRYRDSWRRPDVARQMLELTERQLERPDDAAPYRSFREILSWLTAAEGLPAAATFLDIGCGMGAYGDLLDRWAPGRFRYLGADYSDEILAAAAAHAPQRRFTRKNVHERGALDGFDVVFASALVDVLADYEIALRALLAADAKFVVLHRQRVTTGRPHVDVEPGYRGQWTYRSYITRDHLGELARENGRRIAAEVEVDGDVRSFILERAPC